jgi:HEAT repeat protein
MNRSVAELIRALKLYGSFLLCGPGHPDVRALAAYGSAAVPAMLEEIRSPDGEDFLDRGGGQTLHQMGEAALPGLTAALRTPETAVRVAAVQALAYVGPPGETALSEALGDPAAEVRAAAAYALRWWDAGVEHHLARALLDADPGVSTAAAFALVELNKSTVRDALAYFSALLGTDQAVRAEAEAIQRMGGPEGIPLPGQALLAAAAEWARRGDRPEAWLNVPGVLFGLSFPDAAVRAVAAWELGRTHNPPLVVTQAVLNSLLHALRDPVAGVRVQAARSLGQIGGEQARPAVPVLLAVLKNPLGWGWVRLRIINALGTMLPWDRPSLLPALTNALHDPQCSVRQAACVVLGWAGSDAWAAVPALTEALRDPKSNMRRLAAETLGKIGLGARSATGALAEALRDSAESVRSAAARALGRVGPDTQAEVAALVIALNDSSRWVRREVAKALGSMGEAAGPALTAALRDCRESVRFGAAFALGQWWRLAESPAALIEALRDPKPHLRIAAVRNLSGFAFRDPAAFSALRDALRDKNVCVRACAVRILGWLRRPGMDQVNHAEIRALLSGTLRDPDWRVRLAGVRALQYDEPCLRDALRDVKTCVRDSAASKLLRMGRSLQ